MKNKKYGFTLIEVLLALFILVGAVSIISSLNLKALMRSWLGREQIDRIFLVRKDLYEIFFKLPKQEKPIITRLEKPEIKITREILDISPKSELNDFINFIKVIKSEGEWKSGAGMQNLKIISFVLKPPPEEKKS